MASRLRKMERRLKRQRERAKNVTRKSVLPGKPRRSVARWQGNPSTIPAIGFYDAGRVNLPERHEFFTATERQASSPAVANWAKAGTILKNKNAPIKAERIARDVGAGIVLPGKIRWTTEGGESPKGKTKQGFGAARPDAGRQETGRDPFRRRPASASEVAQRPSARAKPEPAKSGQQPDNCKERPDGNKRRHGAKRGFIPWC